MKYVLSTLSGLDADINRTKKMAAKIFALPKEKRVLDPMHPGDVLAYERAGKDMWAKFYGKMIPDGAELLFDDFPVESAGDTLPAFKDFQGLKLNTILEVTNRKVSDFFGI